MHRVYKGLEVGVHRTASIETLETMHRGQGVGMEERSKAGSKDMEQGKTKE